MNGLLAAFWTMAAKQGTMVQFRRVPSKANGPTRSPATTSTVLGGRAGFGSRPRRPRSFTSW